MMNFKKYSSYGILLLIIFLLMACSINEDGKDNLLTIDDVKGKYEDGKILDIKTIGDDYVLVESQRETFANEFHLYNLENGDADVMPTIGEFVTLEEVKSEDHFIFLSSGQNSETSYGVFPYIIECIRVKNDISSLGDFMAIKKDKYFNLDESISSGSKSYSILSDVVITLDSIQVLFTPIPGEEGMFHAAFSDIPKTATYYNEEDNQLIIKMELEKINPDIEKKEIEVSRNEDIESIAIEKNDETIDIVIDLHPDTEKYMIKKNSTSNGVFFEVSFELRY